MDASQFAPGYPGRLQPLQFIEYPDGPMNKPRVVATHSFIPDPLPPNINWEALMVEHFDLYSKTVAEIGKLNGLHKRVGNAAGMLRTLWMREAKLSSEIEDINTTAEELVLAGAGRVLGVRDSGRESWNYVNALEHGIQSQLPFCGRVIKEMHQHLLQGVRGNENHPGEFRDCNVYLGDRTKGVAHARFVPPPFGQAIADAMSDLEKFMNRSNASIPPLFAIALMHYQFETIHPFRDGNGRIGRVLISRSLVKEGLLEQPVVYMSAYINEHKQLYMDLLLEISRVGANAWSKWIGFILTAIRTQALDAIWRSERLIMLREQFHDRLKKGACPSRLFDIVDQLFAMPAVNIAEVVQRTRVSKPTASNDIEKLAQMKILEEYTGRERERDWVARDIIRVIEEDHPNSR